MGGILRPTGLGLAVLVDMGRGAGGLRRKLIQKELEGSLKLKGHRNQMCGLLRKPERNKTKLKNTKQLEFEY